MHRSITLVDLQLDALNSCLFTYNTFIKLLYMFRALPCSSSGDISRNYIYIHIHIYIYIYMQPLVSSLSACDCTMHRLRRNCSTKFLKFVLFRNNTLHLDEWLTVHRSITFVDFHLVAQNSYLYIYNKFLKSSTCCEHYPDHLQEAYVVIVYICGLWYRHSLQVTVLCTG